MDVCRGSLQKEEIGVCEFARDDLFSDDIDLKINTLVSNLADILQRPLIILFKNIV
jgi:hypothetical protein